MENKGIVLDTNVAITSNGKADQAGPDCVWACINALLKIQDGHHILLLDNGGLVIEEYRCHLSASGQPGPGDAFFKWLWQNQYNPLHCKQIQVNIHADRCFVEFPDDPDLATFDHNDRKFVAVVCAAGTNPSVLNATDTDWWHHRQALNCHGINIEFLCLNLMQRSRRR